MTASVMAAAYGAFIGAETDLDMGDLAYIAARSEIVLALLVAAWITYGAARLAGWGG